MDNNSNEAGSGAYTASAVLESMAWARALVLKEQPRFGTALYSALDSGSRAVVAVLDGDQDRAALHAQAAAHYAFRAVRSLRG